MGLRPLRVIMKLRMEIKKEKALKAKNRTFLNRQASLNDKLRKQGVVAEITVSKLPGFKSWLHHSEAE